MAKPIEGKLLFLQSEKDMNKYWDEIANAEFVFAIEENKVLKNKHGRTGIVVDTRVLDIIADQFETSFLKVKKTKK